MCTGDAMTSKLDGEWCTLELGRTRAWRYAAKQHRELHKTLEDYHLKKLTDDEYLVYVVVQR